MCFASVVPTNGYIRFELMDIVKLNLWIISGFAIVFSVSCVPYVSHCCGSWLELWPFGCSDVKTTHTPTPLCKKLERKSRISVYKVRAPDRSARYWKSHSGWRCCLPGTAEANAKFEGEVMVSETKRLNGWPSGALAFGIRIMLLCWSIKDNGSHHNSAFK